MTPLSNLSSEGSGPGIELLRYVIVRLGGKPRPGEVDDRNTYRSEKGVVGNAKEGDTPLQRRELVHAKLLYFFVFASDASWEPFAAYVLSTRNMSNKMIGVMLTMMTLANAMCGWLFSAVADRYKLHKVIAIVSFGGFVAMTGSLAFNNELWFTAVFGILAQCFWGPVSERIARSAQRQMVPAMALAAHHQTSSATHYALLTMHPLPMPTQHRSSQ